MQINSLYIKNFRGFSEKSFKLNPKFTVGIGNNGTGKSTLLHAVQVAAGSFFLGLPNIVSRRHIEENEIRFEFNKRSKQAEFFTPTVVEATGFINGSGEFTWRREISEYGQSTSSKNSDVGQIRNIGEEYSSRINDINRPELPVIAYFGVQQLGGTKSKKTKPELNRVILRDGYYNALGAKSDEGAFNRWFYYYQDNLRLGREFKGTYEAVIEAIQTAIPYLSKVDFDNFRLEIVADCTIEDQETRRLPHSLMSDGIKRILGIVADIAYRCVILNGFLGKQAVKKTRGVIMIDELDMHLHPNWQRNIVQNLKDAFPNVQFVVTTHSPFIVQSLESAELINLDVDSDVQPKDLSLEEVAEDLMGVDNVYAEDNRKVEKLSTDYLSALETIKLKPADAGDKNFAFLDEIETKISDPSVRAFLKMKRLELASNK